MYHVHITIDKMPKGWKKTDIILEKGTRVETDYMWTKYFQEFPVFDFPKEAKRIKIEKTSNFLLPCSPEHYAEFHCLTDQHLDNPNWVKSRNPKSPNHHFYNRRITTGTMQEAIALAKREITIPYKELKIEQNIYDSNRTDQWWAPTY